MDQQEYNWHINLIKQRYHSFNLTFQQAEQIYKHEQAKNILADESFTEWEEWDYEKTEFKKILNKTQFNAYEKWLDKNIKTYVESLVKLDKEKVKEIAYCEEVLNYYENKFLPNFFNDRLFLPSTSLLDDRAKVDFLRTEYKNYLDKTKKHILIHHFRHYRTFKPNELKASLLRHRVYYLWPNFFFFKGSMDEPTKGVASYLSQKLDYYLQRHEETINKKFNELRAFHEKTFKKHHGEPKGIVIIFGQTTPEEEKEDKKMTLLLLDKDHYNS